jgi:hypothetical protein
MANAGPATEAEAVRAEAAEIMLADHDGYMDTSLSRAHDLVLVHPGSVVAYRLLGELQYAAAVRAAHGEGSSEDHLSAVVPHLRVTLEVHRLTPNCIDIGPPFSSPTALPSLTPRPVQGAGRRLGGGPGWRHGTQVGASSDAARGGSWRLAPGRRSSRLAGPRRAAVQRACW